MLDWLMNFCKTHITLGKSLYKRNKILLGFFSFIIVFQVVFNILIPTSIMQTSAVGALIVFGVLFLFYGLGILTKSKMIKTYYELSSDSLKLTDEQSSDLKTAFWTKNAFWNTFTLMAICYVANIYIPSIPIWLSYWAKDILFFMVLFYGVEAEAFMDKFFVSVKKDFENNL